jgi:hypothetical protein
MAFPTKVQLIKRKKSKQWYINFPTALAQAMEFDTGETVEWIVEHKSLLALRRPSAPGPVLKKTIPSSTTTARSGNDASPATLKPASKSAPKP